MISSRFSMLLLALLVVACSPDTPEQHSEPVDPGAAYVLSAEQLAAVEKEAEAGSTSAMWTLVQHYSLGSHDDERRRFWTAKLAAAEPDNWVSQLSYAGQLIGLGGAENCIRAEKILVKFAQSTDDLARRRSKAALEGMRNSGNCPSNI